MPAMVKEAWGERSAAAPARTPEQEEEEEEKAISKEEWFEEVSNLKQKQVYVERHLRLGLDSLRNKMSQSNHEFQQLTTVADKSEFAKLKEVVDDGLGRVRSSVRYLQNLLSTPATSEMYISALATQMDTCETEIESLKVQQNQDYERLGRVEELLSREIEAFQRRIEGAAWESSSNPSAEPQTRGGDNPVAARKKGSRDDPGSHLRVSRGDLLPEVIEFEEFTKVYGQTGGWTEEDHRDFMRLFQRCGQSYTRVLSLCLAQMPHLTREEIVSHCKWDSEHKNLVRRRRQAIQAWRERKNIQKQVEKKKRKNDFTNTEVEVSQRELQEKLAAKRADDERKRKELAQWKTEKKVQKEEERRRKERQAARSKEREKIREKVKREQAASMLREYQKKKRIEAELIKLQERAEREHKEKKKVSNEDLRYLWERDKIFLQQRKDLCMREELERREIEERKKKIASTFQVHAERNPARLLKPTASQSHRKTASGGPSDSGSVNYIRNVTHLGVPSWRTNLPRGYG
ncbi:hypothetical protein HOP50_02g10900 [Chloropicon primus]|uniref:Coiled-coil domain-containing protein n=1 Tax=Chloropicon primus TaxID=1764295 RepID=A0A5B8MDE4_9CHLO|nr:hypothetical protein A3770_02p11040 [Chloropicon primus]UPQ97795.1 hypothetical protein HOP50_02g10900 [Chloropicon primus]|eukprot:QDZ18586.1 hypothetical protein A3770_02p11040 [Chloropicon primus]